MLNGEPLRARGNAALAARCRAMVRAVLPDLYTLADHDDERVLQGIVDLVATAEPDLGQRRSLYDAVRDRVSERHVLASVEHFRTGLQALEAPEKV